MKVEVIVHDSQRHLDTPLSKVLARCLRVLVQRLDDFPTERPRSRTQSGMVAGHGGILITLDLVPTPRVKVIKPLEGAKK